MTRKQIEARLKIVERLMAAESDVSTLATLNRTYQKLLDMLATAPDT